MNLVDCYVIEILDPPFKEHGAWWLPVKYNSYGGDNITHLMFRSKSDAEAVKPGYKFLN